jgi:hypothetical protein
MDRKTLSTLAIRLETVVALVWLVVAAVLAVELL